MSKFIHKKRLSGKNDWIDLDYKMDYPYANIKREEGEEKYFYPSDAILDGV